MDSKKKNTKSAYASLTGAKRAVPIVLVALAVFIGVCFITPDNVGLGQYIGGFLLGLFSAGGYLVPFFLVLHAIFYPRDVVKHGVLGRIIFTLIALFTFSAFMHTISTLGAETVSFSPAKFYQDGKECVGGGFFGGILGYGLMKVLGPVGLIIFAVLIFALYLTYFFANGKSTLAKILLAVLDKISDTFSKKEEKREAKKEEKRIKSEDKRHPRLSPKHENLYEDEFFSVDNGMKELRIDELGILETRSQADLEKMPHLEEKVLHKSAKEAGDSIFVEELPEEEILESQPEKTPEPIIYEAPEPPKNDTAESIFTKDFDPFDFEANARLSAKQAARAREASVIINEYAEPVKTRAFSESELAAARERDDFERRKRALLEAEERRRELEEEERKQAQLRELLREEAPEVKATYTSYKDEAPATLREDDGFPSPIREADFTEKETFFTLGIEKPEEEPSFGRPSEESHEALEAESVDIPRRESFEAPAREFGYSTAAEKSAAETVTEPADEFKEFKLPETPIRESEVAEDTLKLTREPLAPYEVPEYEDDEEDEEELTGEPEDEEFDEEPIPPEKQNPLINEYRGMFNVFKNEEKEEKHEALVVTNEEPMKEEQELYRNEEEKPPFDVAPPQVFEKPLERKEPEKAKYTSPDYSLYKLPPLDLLKKGNGEIDPNINEEIERNGEKLIDTLAQFNVKASIRSVDVGPRITRYEIVPAKGVRVNSVIGLFDDIALNLAAEGIRMEAPIPGRSAIGVEIPNKNSQMVFLRELLETDEFKNASSPTMACFGKDVTGNPVLGDIAKMPHMLIAGATGMGKSVCINALILSMLFRSRPDELKFIMIDPKMVEFNSYNGIPHLLIPVIIDVKQAAGALMWAVEQMEKRYEMFLEYSVKNLDGYNQKLREKGEKALPKIVIIIDELADLMLQARKPVEDLIMRIAQKARAAGIHLIIGTQRPSVDIITGVIKANIPSRISCKVSSFQDSKTILEMAGAEKLLNNGDMLFWPVGKPKPTRVQGAFVSDKEVENVIGFLKSQIKGDIYDEQALAEINSAAQKCAKGGKGGAEDYASDDGDEGGDGYFNDPQFIKALEVAVSQGKIATSLIQRKLGIGYGKAAKFIDIMQEQGFVSEPNGQKAREVLITKDELHEILARRSLD